MYRSENELNRNTRGTMITDDLSGGCACIVASCMKFLTGR